MPNTHTTLTSLFTDIANAIRNKTGSTGTIVADNFPAAIANIPTGGTSTPPTPTAGDTPVIINVSGITVDVARDAQATGITIAISLAGTYRIKTCARNSYTSGGTTYKSRVQFYKNGTAVGISHDLDGGFFGEVYDDIECSAGDTIEIYASSANSTYKTAVSCLIACINWNNGF